MADIKVTLSADPEKRTESIIQEAKWLEKEGALWYPLQGRPKKADPGCWVYFIREGELAARAKSESFDPPSGEQMYGFKGKPEKRDTWKVRVSKMELAKKHLSYKGFQGFRYVTNEEKEKFEKAFE